MIEIICPCCNNKIQIEIQDDGSASIVFFDCVNINELFDKYHTCFGVSESEVTK